MEAEFNLNFSKTQKLGARNLNINEVILLFQRVDRMANVVPQTYLTHLVKPLDNELIYNENSPTHPWERRVAVIARSEPRTGIHTFPADLNFFKPNWGKLCPIQLLNHQLAVPAIQLRVAELFNNHFLPEATNYINGINNILNDLSNEDFSALEGTEKELFKRHLIRERSPELIRRAKSIGLLNMNGHLHCECCKFDFVEKYGEHGAGFIECHHRIPIATGGPRINSVNDLALVCANCHRMLHRKNAAGLIIQSKN